MDHNFAIQNHTAERYLMDELNETERDAYEEHFFCCAACADEIKSASNFIESARQVVQDELKSQIYGHAAHRSIWGSWLNWRSMLQPIPAAACALLVAVAGFAGYQNSVTIPQLTQMALVHVIPQDTVQMVLAQAHGETGEATVGKPLFLRFAVPKPHAPVMSFNSYQADIVDNADIKKFSITISQQQAQDPVEIFVASGALRPGRYFVVVRGVNRSGTESGVKGELARLPFNLKFGD